MPDEEAHDAAVVSRGFVARLQDDVDLSYAYYPLLLYCLVSGLCDSVAFNAAGVFVSMQTGNTIFLALGASHLPAAQPRLWLKAIVSIGSFQAGAFFFSQFRRFGAQKKFILFLSCVMQAVLVVISAILAQSQVVPAFGDALLSTAFESDERTAQSNDYIVLCPIALMAFNFGGQIYTSRVLNYGEVPTNVLTSLYCDLFSDPKLFAPITTNAKRNRRIAAAVLTILGGVVGGWLQRSAGGMPSGLWIAAGIKIVIALAWLSWPSKAVKVKS